MPEDIIDNDVLEGVPSDIVSPSDLEGIEEDVSSVSDNVQFLKDEYLKYIESSQDVEVLEVDSEPSEVVGFEELISSVEVVNENINKLNENIISLNSSVCLLFGFLVAFSVSYFIFKGLFKNV